MDVGDLEDVRLYVELTAVAAGGGSGALHALRHGFDFVGVGTIGIASGLGGGIIRDVMIGQGPALALRSPALLVTAVAAALAGALLGTFTARLAQPLWWIDSLALGLFAVAGLQRAQAAGLGLVASLFLGVVTTTGGGLVRDVLCRELPIVLTPGQPYAVTALLAGVVYLLALRGFQLPKFVAEPAAVAAAVGVRVLAKRLGWQVPVPPDLAHAVLRLREHARQRPPLRRRKESEDRHVHR